MILVTESSLPLNTLKRQLSIWPFTSTSRVVRFLTQSKAPLESTFNHNSSLCFSHNRRSFHIRYPSNFQLSKRTSKPQSTEHREFQEDKSSIKRMVPPFLARCLDKPLSTSRNPLVFTHGASGISKHTDKLVSHVNDGQYHSFSCGEDSFFRRHDSLGVADGVGGWCNVAPLRNAVANSALYSRKLMHYSYAELEKYDNIDEIEFYNYQSVNPVEIIRKSYEQSIHDCALEGVIGSSTALIAVLRENELRIANIGDCSIGIIRQNSFIFRNEEQIHSFNYPFQLGTKSIDSAKDAQAFTIKVEYGDIIIMGTDGVFDNLYDEDILEEINRFSQPQKGGLQVEPQVISDILAWRAKTVSEDLSYPSPFQNRAIYEGFYYSGGKKDDITCLVAVVTDSRDLSNC